MTYYAKLILLLKSEINYAATIVRGCRRPVVAACVGHQNKHLTQRYNDEWVNSVVMVVEASFDLVEVDTTHPTLPLRRRSLKAQALCYFACMS